MVRTPRMRGGAKKEPTTIDLAPEDVRRVDEPTPEAQSAEAQFAAEESLTPGEAAAGASQGDVHPAAEGVTPEAAQAADSFRFPHEDAATQADEPAPETGEPRPATGPVTEFSEESGPQPGDASTPLFADPPPVPADAEVDVDPPYIAPSAAPEPRSPRTGRYMAAGFIGGALALLLAAILQYLGTLPNVGPQNRIDVEAMRSELNGLKRDVASLRDTQSSAPAPDASLAGAVDALRADVGALQKQGGDGQALTERLGALEQKVDGLAGDTVKGTQIAALSQAADNAGKLGESNRAALAEAVKRIDALEATVSGMTGKVEALGAQPGIALALAASGLKEAVERGAPFEAELGTLTAIAPNLPEAAELQPYAAKGVATLAVIRDGWGAAADAMIASGNPADPDAGLMSRLWSSASGLVSVRPVGAVEGTSVPAVVARMDAALSAGDLAKVVSEYDGMTDAAKQAGANWVEKVRARAAAQALVDRAIASATKQS